MIQDLVEIASVPPAGKETRIYLFINMIDNKVHDII